MARSVQHPLSSIEGELGRDLVHLSQFLTALGLQAIEEGTAVRLAEFAVGLAFLGRDVACLERSPVCPVFDECLRFFGATLSASLEVGVGVLLQVDTLCGSRRLNVNVVTLATMADPHLSAGSRPARQFLETPDLPAFDRPADCFQDGLPDACVTNQRIRPDGAARVLRALQSVPLIQILLDRVQIAQIHLAEAERVQVPAVGQVAHRDDDVDMRQALDQDAVRPELVAQLGNVGFGVVLVFRRIVGSHQMLAELGVHAPEHVHR